MDTIWHETMAELGNLDLLIQARELGRLAAWQQNRIADTGVAGATEAARIEDAYERAEQIADIIGEPSREAFAAGFDEQIDFSLNAEWRRRHR